MTKIKKIVVAAVAAMTMGAIGVTASATTYKYSYFFTLTRGGHQFSAPAEKVTDESFAKVMADTGTVDQDCFVNFSVFSDNTTVTQNCISERHKLEDLRRNFALNYTKERGIGSINYLCSFAGYYGINVNGTWEP